MKRRKDYFFSYLILTCIVSFSISSFALSPPLKILTLNFNAETANKKLKAKRLVVIEDYIKSQNLDVVFIQECWDFKNLKTIGTKLSQDLGMDLAYHLEDGVSGFWVTSLVILTKKNLNLRNTQSFKLPKSALTIGNGKTTWVGLGEVNMLVGGEITLPNGENAFLWTSHLNNGSSQNRQVQVQYALQKMKEVALKAGQSWEETWTVFGGDFNSTPESPEQSYLRGPGGFQDTWIKSHGDDPGHTLTSDTTDPEYNPIVHGAGLFPPQYDQDVSKRIDYIYVHGPSTPGIQATRVFTSPVNNVWMSDHFGVVSTLDFDSHNSSQVPSADSEFSQRTLVLEFNGKNISGFPKNLDLKVNAQGGLTVLNNLSADVQITFKDREKNIYTTSHAGITQNEVVSFSFFKTGNYPYRIDLKNIQNLDFPNGRFTIHGSLQVQ